jgi:signal transduction histidine kinase
VFGAALLRALDLGLDGAPLERALLAYATHSEGLGFHDAALLVWNPDTRVFHGRAAARAEHGEDLATRLDAAKPPHHDPDRQERDARWAMRRFTPETLETVARAAWTEGRVVTGVADGAGRLWGAGEPLQAVVLRRGNTPHGLLILAGARADADAAHGALDRAAAMTSAALGIEARGRSERRRETRAAALAEMARASVSAMNVAEALHLAARLAVRAAGARGSAVWRAHGETLRLEVTHGPAGQRERFARALAPEAEAAALTASPRVIEPAAEARGPDTPTVAGIVPVVAFGRTLGALAVWDRALTAPAESAAFGAADMEFLHTLADGLAMVLDQAARFDALRAAERERSELRARVRREERLAAVGEVAARAAEEVRNPIASVAAFARRAHREMKPDDPLREYVEIVLQEIERIDHIMGEQTALSDPGAPRLKVENVNGIVQRALQKAGEPLVRRRIRLIKKLGADLPALLLDPARIERVVENIVARALDAAPLGGRMRIETRRAGGYVVLEASHDGPHDAGALMEELFAPFAPGRESAGLTLGVARQIIREHGGEVRVRSDAEWSTVLTLTLPILENDDRRRGGERRLPRADRRVARETA